MIAARTTFARTLTLSALVAFATASVGSQAAKTTVAPKTTIAVAPAPALGPSPEQQLAQINAQQAAVARQQLDQNVANQKAYDDAVKAREAEIARVKAAYEAENEQVQAAYDAAVKKWQEDSAACKAGDKKRCAPAS